MWAARSEPSPARRGRSEDARGRRKGAGTQRSPTEGAGAQKTCVCAGNPALTHLQRRSACFVSGCGIDPLMLTADLLYCTVKALRQPVAEGRRGPVGAPRSPAEVACAFCMPPRPVKATPGWARRLPRRRTTSDDARAQIAHQPCQGQLSEERCASVVRRRVKRALLKRARGFGSCGGSDVCPKYAGWSGKGAVDCVEQCRALPDGHACARRPAAVKERLDGREYSDPRNATAGHAALYYELSGLNIGLCKVYTRM